MSYARHVAMAIQSCSSGQRNGNTQLAHAGRSTSILDQRNAGKELPIQFYLQDKYHTFAP